MKTLEDKIKFAIHLLQAAERKAAEAGQPVEICYSGGKDSDVILELARMAKINYRAIYKNTTIDPPGTIKHCKERGVEMIRPKATFGELIAKQGIPSRIRRFCCGDLKEYKILDYAVVGVRKDESSARNARYDEPEECRVYSKNSKCRFYYPLLWWTKEDVAEFVRLRNIRCHPLYYDKKGNFHPERRLGCMCCPLASRNNRLAEFHKHPNMVKYYVRYAQRYLDNHPSSPMHKYVRNAYEWFVLHLFYDNLAQFKEFLRGGGFVRRRSGLQKVAGTIF